jgi:hypothetical protein
MTVRNLLLSYLTFIQVFILLGVRVGPLLYTGRVPVAFHQLIIVVMDPLGASSAWVAVMRIYRL